MFTSCDYVSQRNKARICAAAVQSKLCHCVIHNGVANHSAGSHEWLKEERSSISPITPECSANQDGSWSVHGICLCENTKPCECVVVDVNMLFSAAADRAVLAHVFSAI